jgi:tetratricopeptide (TPR) repeat protein
MQKRTQASANKRPRTTAGRPGRRPPPPEATAAPTRRHLALPAAAAILALACLAAYGNSFRAELLLDNETIILKDPRLQSAAWESVWGIFTHHYWWPAFESTLFRPLTTLSYWFNYSVLGNREHAFGYHAVNLLLHWACATLVYVLVRVVTRRPLAALFAAAVFAVHPLTVESVTNVVGRADLLAALSVLGGLLCYLEFRKSTGRRAAGWLAGLGASYLAGVFCKESAVVLPGIMLLHDFAFRAAGSPSRLAAMRRWAARAWPAGAAVLPGLAALIWARWALFRHSPLVGQFGSDNPIAVAPLWTGVMTAVKVAGYYLALVVWPARLSCDYSYNQITLFGWSLAAGQDLHAWLALAAVAGLAAGAAVAWRRDRGVFFFLGFAAIAFLPTSNLLFPIGTIMAERLMYLPLAGLSATATLTVAHAGRRVLDGAPSRAMRGVGIAWKVVAVAVVVALAGRTVARNEDWTSGLRLWSSSAQAAPNSIKLIRAIATTTMAADPSGGGPDAALAIALRGVRIAEQAPLPLYHQPAALFAEIGHYYSSRAALLAARGESVRARNDYAEAVAMLKRAEQIDREVNRQGREKLLRLGVGPDEIHDTGTAIIYRNLGAAYLGLGDPDRAIETLSYLRHLEPASFDALYVLAMAEGAASQSESARGNRPQAAEHLERAAVDLIEAILLNRDHDPSWQALEHVYRLLAPWSAAALVSADKRTLDMDEPMVRRHVGLAGEQLVRDLDQAGLTEVAARVRRRLTSGLDEPAVQVTPAR